MTAPLAAAPAASDTAVSHRVGEVTVTVLGPDGRPVTDEPVTVEQQRHAFSFGNIGFDFVSLVGGAEPPGAEGVEAFGGTARLDADGVANAWLNLSTQPRCRSTGDAMSRGAASPTSSG
jgi:endo-1,4-beta-xylanase